MGAESDHNNTGVIGSKGVGHVVGGWRVRRGAMGGFVRHVGIGHGGRSIEDVENDAADM